MQPLKRTAGVKVCPLSKQGTGHRSVPRRGRVRCGLPTFVDGYAAREEPLGTNAERERLARTIEVWSPRSSRPLTEGDAREICENVLGFFRVLIEWKARQAASTSGRDRDAA